MAPTCATANNRGWGRDYFIDHPGLKSKLADASTGTGQLAKAKVYCNKCFESHVNAVLGEDQLDVNAVPPLRQAVRAVADIEAHCKFFIFYVNNLAPLTHQFAVWSMEASSNGRGWLRSAKTTLLRHLQYCELNTDMTQSCAEDDHIAAGGATSLGKGHRKRQPDPPLETYLNPILTQTLGLPNSLPAVGSSTGFGTMYSLNSPQLSLASLPPLPSMFPLPIPFADGPPYSPLVPNSTETSAFGSSLLSHYPNPLQRTASQSSSHQVSFQLVLDILSWSSVCQKQFERSIAHLIASAGLPLSWVDNAEWIAFVEEFLPATKSPSRKVLTNRLIPMAVAKF